MKVTLLFLLFVFTIYSDILSQSTGCDCWQTRDNSWSIAQFDGSGGSGGPGLPPEYRNDDWSTDTISLPFTFCFFGDSIQSFIINNNGNISFLTTMSTFGAFNFPNLSFKYIAPFWADVDTRAPLSGVVHYKIFPHYTVVQWDSVGYYGMHDDKLNTFQLIFSDGDASPLSVNNNVGFCYKEMQWTTGDASQGTNGFGGIPAAVGINYGDGVHYLQIGLFDDSTAIYDGPFGNNDGVFSLSNMSIESNICINNFNIPPVLIGTQICDTNQLCVGDTFNFSGRFLAPEMTQNIGVTIFDHGMTGVHLIASPGNQSIFSFSFIAANPGVYTVDLIGIDNFLPAAYTTHPFTFNVQNCTTGLTIVEQSTYFISPNPFNNELKYSFGEKLNIRITDISGKIILNNVDVESGSINTSQWRNGIYFMEITSDKTTKVIKLLKN